MWASVLKTIAMGHHKEVAPTALSAIVFYKTDDFMKQKIKYFPNS